jgi:hypothetical protein
MLTYTNGSGAAIPAIPKQTITGRSLVHRRLSKVQRAVLAADVIDGLAQYVQTDQQVAAAFGVSGTYVLAARKLSPRERSAILQGYDVVRFAELLRPPRQLSLARPTLPDLKVIPDSVLENLVRSVGTDRLLSIACAVESAT